MNCPHCGYMHTMSWCVDDGPEYDGLPLFPTSHPALAAWSAQLTRYELDFEPAEGDEPDWGGEE